MDSFRTIVDSPQRRLKNGLGLQTFRAELSDGAFIVSLKRPYQNYLLYKL